MATEPESELDRTTVVKHTVGDVSSIREEIGHYLVVVEGSGNLARRIEVGAKPLTLGRDQSSDVVLADSEVSRQHLQCVVQNNEFVATDLGSTNGTFLDGVRLTEPTVVPDGSILQLGRQVLKYERRSKQDVLRTQELNRDLAKASNYVLSLLPEPLREGPVLTDWFFLPSAQLGGDAFGYYALDDDHFVAYVVDVSGHGVGAAMHSVSVLNVLRQRALPGTDFRDPAAVLKSLNGMFQMDTHDGQYFTMWYGVYNTRTRTLRFATAGHHAGYLVSPDKTEAAPLQTKSLMIGAMPGYSYRSDEVAVPPGMALYLFSDGVFEIITKDEGQWSLNDFLPVLLEPAIEGTDEPQRIYQAVKNVARSGPFDDDFSLLVVTFC